MRGEPSDLPSPDIRTPSRPAPSRCGRPHSVRAAGPFRGNSPHGHREATRRSPGRWATTWERRAPARPGPCACGRATCTACTDAGSASPQPRADRLRPAPGPRCTPSSSDMARGRPSGHSRVAPTRCLGRVRGAGASTGMISPAGRARDRNRRDPGRNERRAVLLLPLRAHAAGACRHAASGYFVRGGEPVWRQPSAARHPAAMSERNSFGYPFAPMAIRKPSSCPGDD